MQIGITGHQSRPGIDWCWVESALRDEITKLILPTKALSSLAKGSDQLFATVALSLKIAVLAVIPSRDYTRNFKGKDRDDYEDLLRRCEQVHLNWTGEEQEGFFEAGKFVANNS